MRAPETEESVGSIGIPLFAFLSETAFKPGWKGGPGRPPGKRNYLTEIAFGALGDDFALHGAAVIKEVRETKPLVYLQVVASLLPRQVQMEKLSPLGELTDEELLLLEEHLAAHALSLYASLSSTMALRLGFNHPRSSRKSSVGSSPLLPQILPIASNARHCCTSCICSAVHR
jgi:hypothetical protein